MRLDEFYHPEQDDAILRKPEDTRKPKLTLEILNKMRKVKEIKQAEEIEHKKFVKVMYKQPSEEGDGLL
jgi:hypothetical protein